MHWANVIPFLSTSSDQASDDSSTGLCKQGGTGLNSYMALTTPKTSGKMRI